ncbi:PA3496 family putative envelope integrity protein [Thalassotalea ganghwensis]
MTYDSIDDLDNDMTGDQDADFEESTSSVDSAKVRKRIDDLLERKRLKELLDDTDDWDI